MERQRIPGREARLSEAVTIRRVLPSRARQMVGPFIFLDHIGPLAFPPGQGLDVLPHPHIGLATVTYLFEGALMHRDSLGVAQEIRPGEVNWMTAGRGIVHSERTPAAHRGGRLHGVQIWVALPEEDEACAPAFAHHPRADLPRWEQGGATLTLIAGALAGQRSPVTTHGPLLFVELALQAGAALRLPQEHEELGIYVVSGAVRCAGEPVAAGELLVLGEDLDLRSDQPSRALLLGGASYARRAIRWNFVASDPALIDEAARRWRAGEFPEVP